MQNFWEPWTKHLNLVFKKTIMTALDRPGELPPQVSKKSTMEPNKFDFC